jgi:hypothetical protein
MYVAGASMLLWCLHFTVQMFVMNCQLMGTGNQTYMELQNRTVGLRQQVQHTHHVEIPNPKFSEPQQMHPDM